ncbi:MAG: PepSY-associated TM helix domain-containing protein [Bacteroidales bacterium]|nr:PepSY-associated TM helix domain-containing protein [Bacteroidales bacterium]
MKKLKWIHKWFSLVLGVFLILWALSGVVLNHRELVSHLSIDRNWLPPEYHYKNWNNASFRSGLRLGGDTLLLYGNMGIWQTDTGFSFYKPFNEGLDKGIDNQRIMKLQQTKNGLLFAATQSGLYSFDHTLGKWVKVDLNIHDNRIADLCLKDGKLVALSRSEVLLSTDDVAKPEFLTIKLPSASNDDNKVGLFRTLWVIHSGEIAGVFGKLIVDFFALLLIFFVLTGYIYFFFPKWIRKRKRKQLNAGSIVKVSRFSIKWHNHLGIWLGWFLIITTLTGIFLRPPLLIAIGNLRVGKIPFSMLDNPNHWHDKLRAIHWNDEKEYWMIASNDGLFQADEQFLLPPEPFPVQPPLSVMGINVLEYQGNNKYLIGSFNGLFIWNPESGFVRDVITGELPQKRSSAGSPIGQHLIAGYLNTSSAPLIFDYNAGLITANLPMPAEISDTPMPLWNLALETHTARVFQHLAGLWYILIIPVFGLSVLAILITGLFIWLKKKR